jgi:hypothetical protein
MYNKVALGYYILYIYILLIIKKYKAMKTYETSLKSIISQFLKIRECLFTKLIFNYYKSNDMVFHRPGENLILLPLNSKTVEPTGIQIRILIKKEIPLQIIKELISRVQYTAWPGDTFPKPYGIPEDSYSSFDNIYIESTCHISISWLQDSKGYQYTIQIGYCYCF